MITMAVVEDHPVYRNGLCRVIAGEKGMGLLGAYSSVECFISDGIRPEVVLLDLNLPGRGGPEGVACVRAAGAEVLVVSASAARDDVLDAVAAGAAGYLTKDAEPAEIVAAATLVSSGGTYVSPTLAGYLLAGSHDPVPPGTALTLREQEILRLLARGERDQDIADQLFISIRTVRSHLDRIRDKTGHRRRADLTRFAIEHRVVPPGS